VLAPPAPTIEHPVMFQDWRELTFLHWRYPVDAIQRLLPPGVEVETCQGEAWVSLVPFLMDRVRVPGVPALPWLSRFPETNVRTYVRGRDGRSGIWFFSLDATRLPAVLAGRSGFGLPYRWAAMSVRRSGDMIAYRSRRRWPGPSGAYCDAEIEAGEPIAERDLGEVDHFLTARFRLYSVFLGRLVAVDAAHEPWPLHRARLGRLRQSVIEAAGLPSPSGEPLLHASPGVSVRLSRTARLPAGNRPISDLS
jgi:uncharacterized protein YqjF (DUF2071 family)